MKILMINKFLFPNGGSETYIFKLGEYLKSLNHEVQYFGMEHPDRCVSNHVNAYTSEMDFHKGSKLSKVLYPIKTIYSLEARKKIRLVLDDFMPDVCHINNFNYQLTPSIILEIVKWRKETGKTCKIIYTAHDYQLVCPNHMCRNPLTNKNCEKCLSGSFLNCTQGKCIHGSSLKSIIGSLEAYFWKYKGVYNDIDAIICPSAFMKSKLDVNPIFSKKTIVLHNFIDNVKKERIDKKDYILYFGRLSKEKGIDTLLEVVKELKDIPFIFAGSGEMEDDIKNVSNINYVGFKTGDELVKLIKEARLSVYTSQWYENCPFSVMESISYGTPVVGAHIGGIPELINEKTGVLFRSEDANDLKEKILSLYNDEEFFESFYELNECFYDDLNTYYDKLVKIYQEEK